ncbi:MAG: hypothetical protein M0R80_07445 [Proteobacteria bacterium]|nr:hypothetical protein [Pseudomonadota bacterium]
MSDKTKDRPYMGMGVLQGDAAAGTTIVGGQPSETRRGARQRVPIGLERALYAAAAEPGFRAELLGEREAALSARGIELTASERAVLRHLPGAQLEAMIDRLDVSQENLRRRGFMRAVASSVITLAAGTALGACSAPASEPQAQGGAPFLGPSDVAADASVPPEPQPPFAEPAPPPAGIRPDVPVPPDPVQPIGGIQPDKPQPPMLDVDPPASPATRGARAD